MAANIIINKNAGYTGDAIIIIKEDKNFGGCKIQSSIDIINTLMRIVDKRLTSVEETQSNAILLE